MTPTELFESNQPLVYSAIRKQFPTYAFDEDVIQDGMVGLWRACQTFQAGYGALSTYAYTCILNAVRMQFRKKRIQAVSLEQPISDDDRLCLGDMIPDTRSCAELESVETDFIGILSHCTDRQRKIVQMRIDGLKQTDIAKAVGVSQVCVSRDLAKVWRLFENESRPN